MRMERYVGGDSSREIIKDKLRRNFDGKIVRKDLTKKIKEGANVPVYVLEFLWPIWVMFRQIWSAVLI
jgi:ATP-dependent Lon protease